MNNPFLLESERVTTQTNQVDLKLAYADELLRNPLNAFEAARRAFPNDIDLQTMATLEWANSREIRDIQKLLISDNGIEEYLPKREQIIFEIHERAKRSFDDSEYVKLTELMVKIMGWIKKESVAINNNLMFNVMEVPMAANNQEWQSVAVQHQQNLKRISIQETTKE